MKPAFAILLGLALAACAAPPPPPPPPLADDGLLEREPDTCGIGAVSFLYGQPSNAPAAAGVKQDYRVIGPRDVVTQDYFAQRVNFHLDEQGRIARITCG